MKNQYYSKNERLRALDEVENGNHPWPPFNYLFHDYINYFEEVCKVGTYRTNTDYFVQRYEDIDNRFASFEQRFSDEICFCRLNMEIKPFHRIKILYGNVGTGKTTFLDYIEDKIISKKYTNIHPLFINLSPVIFEQKDKELVENNFSDIDVEDIDKFSNTRTSIEIKRRIVKTIETNILQKYFNTECDYKKEFVKYLGYQNSSNVEIDIIYNNNVTEHNYGIIKLLTFIDWFAKKTKKFKKIILMLDNLDENPKQVIRDVRYLINALNSYSEEHLKYLDSTILVTIRNYNKDEFEKFFKQTNPTRLLSLKELPPVSSINVAKRKFEEMRDKIEKYANNYTQEIDNSKYYNITGKITITKKTMVLFLQKLIDRIFDVKNDDIISFFIELASGNLKILVSNIFNLVQSCKLPLSNLFQEIYTSPKEKIQQTNFTVNLSLECLMSIKYPFFDVKSSRILNIFSLYNDLKENNYQNTLIISRLLFLLFNFKYLSYNNIILKFNNTNYSKEYIDDAISKCLDYGLIDMTQGIKINHIRDSGFIRILDSGKRYLTDLIHRLIYLQFVCEDVEMDKQYYIPILKKYRHEDDIINRKIIRVESAYLFIDFIKSQEKLELRNIIDKKILDKQEYLNDFSIRYKGKGIKVSDYIKKELDKHFMREKMGK
jgi:hypothetical protein